MREVVIALVYMRSFSNHNWVGKIMESGMGDACSTHDIKRKIQGMERCHLEELGVDRRVILKFILNK